MAYYVKCRIRVYISDDRREDLLIGGEVGARSNDLQNLSDTSTLTADLRVEEIRVT